MAYYFNHLDRDLLAELVVRAGRAGHQIRNFTQGYNTLQYPEILTIDTLSGQIEGQCRALRSQIENKNDLKPTLRNAIRPAVFLESMVRAKLPEYVSEMDCENFKNICELLGLMRQTLKEADQRVNRAILKDSLESFSEKEMPALQIEKAAPESVKRLEDAFCVEFSEALKLTGTEDYATFKRTNQKLGTMICNKAHQIQDLASVYNQTAPANQQTNQIINVAGQIENQSRDVQAKLENYGRVNLNKVGLHNGIKQNCDKLVELATQLEQITQHVNCPLKLAGGGAFETLYQTEVELWQILKSNNEKGFAI